MEPKSKWSEQENRECNWQKMNEEILMKAGDIKRYIQKL
jgi:hypothetical protein